MTDTPSRPPETPAAPESATPETPVRPGIPAQAAGPAPTVPPGTAPGSAPGWNAAPGWGGLPTAPVPGWEWSHGWIPRPGIIPLRPLAVSDILSGTFALLRRYWKPLLPFTAVIAVVAQVASTLLSSSVQQSQDLPSPFASSQDPSADLRKSLNSMVDTIPGLGAIELITIIATALAAAVVILVAGKAVIGRPISLSEVWESTRPRLPQVLGLAVLMTLLIGGVLVLSFGPVFLAHSNGASDGALSGLSLLTLPGTVIALWLTVSTVMAAPALMLERQGIRSAFARSFRLVRGSWWRTFGILLLVLLLNAILEGLISVPFALGAFASQGFDLDTTTSTAYTVLSCIGGIIGMTLTLPVIAGSIALLYMDQRIRREALDVSLATAAGVPDYAHPNA